MSSVNHQPERTQTAKKVAVYGVLAALALVLSWLEAQIPVTFAVPGMKLGLTNVVVLLALYGIDTRSALIINLVRIFLVAFLFGNGISLLFSLAGGMLSTAVMILMKKTGRFRIITVSILGGVTHNIGQILVAMALLETVNLAWYLPVLWFAGLGSGALIGLLGGILCRRLKGVLAKNS